MTSGAARRGAAVERAEQRLGPRRSLWPHALGLLALVAVLAMWTGTRSAFVTDESFVVIQLDHIEATGDWTLPHPFPSVDPDGRAFALHGATRFQDGYTLYGKHPLLIYLYLPVHRLAGLGGLVGLSVLGTVAAALVAGLLAERLRRGSGVAALWITGAASPLLFDALVIHAHTLAAALAALAVLLALDLVDGRPWPRGLALLASLLAVGMLRTEGLLFVGAVGLALTWRAARQRRVGLAGWAAAATAMAPLAVLVDRLWAAAVAGGPAVPQGSFPPNEVSYLAGRLSGIAYTLLLPGYRGGTVPEMLTVVGVVVLVCGAVVVRTSGDRAAIALPLAGAAVLLVRPALLWGPIPGLVLAFCVAVVGLVLSTRDLWGLPAARFALMVTLVFGLGVVMTQYPAGGHTEWGGRYFALCVPLLGALAAAALVEVFEGWPLERRLGLGVSLAAATLGLGVLAVVTVHAAHDRNRTRTDAVLAAAEAMPPAADGGRPVVVTEDEQIPRLARGRYGEVRFLNVSAPYVGIYLDRLAARGVRDVLVVSKEPDATLDLVPDAYEEVGAVHPQPLQYTDDGGLIRLHLRARP